MTDATALVATYPIDPAQPEAARAWEAALVSLARGRLSDMAAAANLSLSFSTERSVADELQRESAADVPSVAGSYAAMLAYIALALGGLPRSLTHPLTAAAARLAAAITGKQPQSQPPGPGSGPGTGRGPWSWSWLGAAEVLVTSRAGLGLGGVAVVGASVAGALGLLCGPAGLPATLIVLEVVPFLGLAVGVDNMFLLAHALAAQVLWRDDG